MNIPSFRRTKMLSDSHVLYSRTSPGPSNSPLYLTDLTDGAANDMIKSGLNEARAL